MHFLVFIPLAATFVVTATSEENLFFDNSPDLSAFRDSSQDLLALQDVPNDITFTDDNDDDLFFSAGD